MCMIVFMKVRKMKKIKEIVKTFSVDCLIVILLIFIPYLVGKYVNKIMKFLDIESVEYWVVGMVVICVFVCLILLIEAMRNDK